MKMPPLLERSQNQCCGPEPLVGGVVLEVAVQEVAERLPVDQRFDRVEERVVALHQVRGQQQAAFAGRGDQFVGLFERDGQRLFADDVLAVRSAASDCS